MNRRLRHDGGGDPTQQGPVPELAAEPHAPDSVDEFPDVPGGNRPGGEGVPPDSLDQEQLDDFAQRLGLGGQDEERDESEGREPETDQRARESGEAAGPLSLRRPVSAAAGTGRRALHLAVRSAAAASRATSAALDRLERRLNS